MPTIVIITDGIDEHSKTKPSDLKSVVSALLDTGLIHRITMIGAGNFDFKTVGSNIGIEHVIEINRDPKELRRALDTVSSHITR